MCSQMYSNINNILFVRSTTGMFLIYFKTTAVDKLIVKVEKESDSIINLTSFTSFESLRT